MEEKIKFNKNFINTKPSKHDIDEILNWLKEEKNNSSDNISFYCNKNIIIKEFKNGNSIVFKHKKKNIGLAIWHSTNKFCVNIDIFVIHPSYRQKGFGHLYYKKMLIFFITKGFKVIMLLCTQSTSKLFWEKVGLIKFPNCIHKGYELYYYKVLINTASKNYINTADKIELWDVDSYKSLKIDPKWTWYIKIKNGVLLFPIIQPCNCNCNWKMRWSRNGKIIKEEKVKYFTNENYELYNHPFLYIKELK